MDLSISENRTIYEKKLIGGILSGAVTASSIAVDPSDLTEFGPALDTCRQIEAAGKKPDADTLYQRLVEKFPDDLFYAPSDYKLFAEMAPSSSVALEAVDKIKAHALKTFLSERISTLLADEKRSGAAMLDELKAMIAVADRNYRSSENNFLMLSEVVTKLEAVYRDMHSGVSYAVPTGFPCLDEMLLDGFSKGDLHVIVGLTGHGKSGLALNCARYQAESGNFVGVVSREMSDTENAMRLQSSMQQIPRWQIRRGIHDLTYQELCRGFDALRQLPIAFDVRTADIDTLRIQVKRLVEQFDLKILYVDYLQLVGVGKTRGSRAEDVAAVSRGLKEIAMENNIPVVALSQFSRAALTADVHSLLGCLKESSGIEQDSSTVTYIQVDNSNPDAAYKPAKIYVLKNRNGQTFKPILFNFHGQTFTFTEEGYDYFKSGS
ncbi:MAG: DnaB-like helicase C-terminal domain-containing protein [Acidobacteria bacterium]|nr:DnaB-like helicase C-terminal domain-containing protein [Acidobacteriota bacterium]